MKKTINLQYILCVFAILMFVGLDCAASSISPDWPANEFVVTDSDRLAFQFTIPVPPTSSQIDLSLPTPQVNFSVSIAGIPCAIDGSASCMGVVVTLSHVVGATTATIHLNPDDGGTAAPVTVSAEEDAGALGNWAVTASSNIDIQWVHAIPDISVDIPELVLVGQSNINLIANATEVFESDPAIARPTISQYSWSMITGSPCPSLSSTSSTVSFNAPSTAVTCEFSVTVTDSGGPSSPMAGVSKGAVIIEDAAKPVDAVMLIDTSGSMGWHRVGSAHDLRGGYCSRLAAAKMAAKYFINRLGTFDTTSRAGVAIFPGAPAPSNNLGARWYPPDPPGGLATADSFNDIVIAIGGETQTYVTPCDLGSLPADPGTPAPGSIPVNWNGTPTTAGLEKAQAMLPVGSDPNERSRIIVLLSDGAWNVGDNPENFNANGIHIYTIGIGSGTDNVNFSSLTNISVNSGVGDAGNPIGFSEFNTDNPATDPNLFPHFEKILTDMAHLDFESDPVATINPGKTNTHTVLVTDHDSLVSFTVSWESTSKDLLDAYVLSPQGQKIDAQLSASGYKNITVGRRILQTSGNTGEWKLVVRYPNSHLTTQLPKLIYNYSVVTKSTLNMRIAVDKDKYFTGDTMLLETRLIENSRRLKGGIVTVNVSRPKEGIGNWHFANIVAENQLKSVPDEISGEPLTQLDKKNFVLLQQMQINLPKIISVPKVNLNDNGKDGDKYPNDGIYSGRFSGLSVPGIYRFRITASGTAKNGQAYRREMEVQKYVDIIPDANVTDKERAIEKVNPDGSAVMRVSVTPFDAAKNYLGPGYADKIEIISSIGEPIGEVRDMLYGAYERKFNISASDIAANPNITIKVKGVVVNDGPIITPPPTYKWEISGHLGYTFPQGNLSNNFDGGFSGMLDLAYRFTRSWSVEALLGHHRFGNKSGGTDFSWTHVSLNGKYSYPVGLFRVFANGGGGWYVPESGDSGFGWNVGAGINYSLSERLGIDLGYYYHHVSKGERNEFSTLSLGVRYRFK